MALWYAREEGKHLYPESQYYVLGPKRLCKTTVYNGISWGTKYRKKVLFDEVVSVCPIAFEKVHPKSMHLPPGEGPYKLKPLERA